jgi:putative Mg2+ transporter-C (MgtC) family protein
MELSTFAVRILIAFLLGIAIGVERQWRQRMAGLRTNALVAVGAALFSSLSILMGPNVNQTQIAAYVVSGIGFLAGAVIFKEGFTVRGLNTAATMWGTAAVGTLCGSGFLAEGAIGAAIVLAANVLLRPIVQSINRQPFEQSELSRTYDIVVTCSAVQEEHIRSKVLETIAAASVRLRELESHDVTEGRVQIIARVVSRSDEEVERVVGVLSLDPHVVAARWSVSGAVDEEGEEAPVSP